MITSKEDEKKKSVIMATGPAGSQTTEPVPPVQETSQPLPNVQAQDQKVQSQVAENKPTTATQAKTQQSQSVRVNQTQVGGPGLWSQRLGAMASGTPYLNRIAEIDKQLPKAIEDYQKTGRNPLADIILAQQKPVRNVDEETRLRQNAKLQALNNVFSLIGKGVAATGGIRPAPSDNRPIYDIQNRLQRLDDIYRQEGVRYDQNALMAALRKDQANLNASQQAIASLTSQRKDYADMYKDAEDRHQKGVFKGAELDAANQKLQVETALKVAGLNETARHNRTGESLGWAKYNAANPKTFLKYYRTGEHVELTPEVEADMVGVIAQAIAQRESAEKNGGNTYVIGNGPGSGPLLTNDETGNRPLPLNNYFTDKEIEAFEETGKLSAFKQAALTRLYNDMQNGEFYDPTGAPSWIPKLPDTNSYHIPSQRSAYLTGLSETLAGLIQSDILNGGDGKFTPDIIREYWDGQIANLSDNDLKRVISEAETKFKK